MENPASEVLKQLRKDYSQSTLEESQVHPDPIRAVSGSGFSERPSTPRSPSPTR